MYNNIEEYQSPGVFAGQYTGKRKKKGVKKPGVSRQYILELINQERVNQGSTGLDVLEINGVFFVRYSKPDQPVITLKSQSPDNDALTIIERLKAE
jgi:hypothetical protein